MISILAIVNKYFWKTIYGPLFSFIFPSVMLVILGNIMRIDYVYPGIIAMSLMFIGMLSLPMLVTEFGSSSLAKYAGTSQISPRKYIFSITLFFVLVSILATAVIFVVTSIAFDDEVNPDYGPDGIFSGLETSTGVFSFIVGWTIHLGLVMVAGHAIAVFVKTPQQTSTLAFSIVIPSMFLSGMIISVDLIAHSDFLQWVSRLVPFRYSTANLIIATTPEGQSGDLFDILSVADKNLIFNAGPGIYDANSNFYGYVDIVPNGNIEVFTYDNNGDREVLENFTSSGDVLKFVNDNPVMGQHLLGDEVLFDLLFIQPEHISKSGNNVFNFGDAWGVRRFPDVDDVRGFVSEYLRGPGTGGDEDRFKDLWIQIQADDYSWLDMFFKQNSQFYEGFERALNVFIPLILIGGLQYFNTKNHKWAKH